MKKSCLFSAAVAVILGLAGCHSTQITKAPAPKGDLQFTKEITATVTADQGLVMDGKKYTVAEVPSYLAGKNVSKYITIMVMPESKMSRETLVELVKTLVQSNYFVAIDEKSKYADVPIPPRS